MIRPTSQIYENYTSEDFNVWETLFNRQMETLKTAVSVQYLEAIDVVGFTNDKIPNFTEVNKILNTINGWKIEVVPNICPDQKFFQCIANKTFTSTCWLRSMEQLDYLEEPDMFHDVFGHIPLLSNTSYANFFTSFGNIALKFIDNPTAIQLLSRLYWYTIEFGMIKEKGDLKIYGAGIISSSGETKHAIDPSTTKIHFDIKTIFNTAYRTDIIQDKYFVIDSFDQLYNSIGEIESCLREKLKGGEKV
jgi:phenylalanine-4-hydroxylase